MTEIDGWRRALWQAIGHGLTAHIVMLRDVGIVDDASAAALLDAADGISRGNPPDIEGSLALVAAFEERFDSVTAAGIAGGGRIARARHDLAATAQRLVLRDRVLALIAASHAAQEALLDLTDGHVFTLMNAWSGSTPLQPTTFAHFLTGTTAPLARASSHLRAAYEDLDRSPLGAGALTGSGLPIDRDETADLLGCEGPVESTFDALAASDHLTAIVEAAAATVSPIRRLVEELLLWSRTDPYALRLADELLATADPNLPHFRPAVVLERLVRDARGVERDAASVVRMAAELGYGPMGERADDIVSGTDRTLRGALAVTGAAATILSGPIEINRAWLARAAGRDLVTSGDLADFLMAEEGLDPVSAREIAAITANRARQEGLEASGITPAMIDAAALLIIGRELGIEIERLGAYLAPRRFIEKRAARGGPAAPAVRDYLALERDRLASSRLWLEARQRRIAQARENLEIRTGEILTAAASG